MNTLIDYVPLNTQFPRTFSGFRYQQYRRDRTFIRQWYPSGLSVFKTIEQDVTVTQTIGKRLSITLLVSQSITLTQSVENLLLRITQTATVTQTIAFFRVINLTLSQTATVTQTPFIQSPRVITVLDTANVTQTIVDRLGINKQTVGHLIFLTDTATGRLGTYQVTVSQTATVSQTLIRRDQIIIDSISQTATLSQSVGTEYNKSVAHFASVLFTVHGFRELNYSLLSAITLNSDFSYTRFYNQTLVTETLLLSDLTRIVTLTIPITDLIISLNTFTPLVLYTPSPPTTLPPLGQAPPLPPIRPTSPGTNYVNSRYTILSTKKGTIVLPVPELGDTLSNADSLVFKYNMVGDIRTYVTSSPNRTFSLTFNLSRAKALELREWITINLSLSIIITLWKGEIWEGNLMNDDLEFLAENRWANEREKIVITLDFEGVKTHG